MCLVMAHWGHPVPLQLATNAFVLQATKISLDSPCHAKAFYIPAENLAAMMVAS